MAALVSTTPVQRHVIGDLAIRFFTITGLVNGDTLTVNGVSYILFVISAQTVAQGYGDQLGITWSGSVITFASPGGTWAGTVAVISKT